MFSGKPAASRTSSSLPAVPLTVRVGFVGHRTIDEATVVPAIEIAFRLLAECLGRIAALPVADATGADDLGESLEDACGSLGGSALPPQLHLLTGDAPGADRAAIGRWISLREKTDEPFGSIHCLLPFLDPQEPERFAWTDRPEHAVAGTRVDLGALTGLGVDRMTVLDGASSLRETPGRDPHVEQGRWLVRWCDIVVAVWNGRPPAGPGGTADSVISSLRLGVPVLWIDTGEDAPVLRLLRPESFWADTAAGEVFEFLAAPEERDRLAPALTGGDAPAAIVEVIAPPLLPPRDAHDRASRRSYATNDVLGLEPRGAKTRWRTWLFNACFPPIGDALAGVWKWFLNRFGRPTASATPRSPAVPEVPPLVALHGNHASDAADFAGSFHRGSQLFLLWLAVVAVALGTSPVLFEAWPAIHHAWKPWAVSLEALVISLTIGLLGLQYVATNHRRWGESRRFAERMRCLRATWPLGFDVSDLGRDPPVTWTEWQARTVLRAVGPPQGRLSAAVLLNRAAAVRDDPYGIVAGQKLYHSLTSRRFTLMHHRLETIEGWALSILLVCLVVFIALHVLARSLGHGGDVHGPAGLAVWPARLHAFLETVGGPLLMISAVVPTICAACLALDAKLGVDEHRSRSRRLAAEFAAIESRMAATTSPAESVELTRDAARIVLQDVDQWQDAAVRRRIATL